MVRLVAFIFAFGLALGFALPSGKDGNATAEAATPGQQREVVLTRGSTGHFFTDAKVNGKASVHFIVDTGASTVALTVDDARRLGLPIDPANFEVIAEGAGGPVRGQMLWLDSVDVDGIRAEKVRAMVLEGSSMSLLGQTFLARVDQVSMSGDYLSLRDGA
jgi:aspartyl protease family protein